MRKARATDELRPEYQLSDFKGKGVRGKYYKRVNGKPSDAGPARPARPRKQATRR